MADFTFAHRQEGFDEHIDWSIRGYSNLLDDVVSLSRYFVEANTNVVDIGCSTGKLTARILEHNHKACPDAQYVGVEVAEGFFGNLADRKVELSEKYPDTSVNFIEDDIRNYEFKNCSLITSLFTLQFMPYSCREEVINNIYDGLNSSLVRRLTLHTVVLRICCELYTMSSRVSLLIMKILCRKN